jgi:shikimate dehydrogenase
MYVASEGGRIDSSAEKARAVNTIIFNEDGSILGANTDGKGLVADIKDNLGFGMKGKRILILGSGGAAWGVLYPFAVENPESITISSRTIAKAEEMGATVKLAVKELKGEADRHTNVFVKNFSELEGEQYDIVINATSAGLTDTALPIPNTIFAKGCLAYDMMYGRETPFMKQARESGAQVADGLGMLVEQAAEAFYLWRGVRPETQSVIKKIRNLA